MRCALQCSVFCRRRPNAGATLPAVFHPEYCVLPCLPDCMQRRSLNDAWDFLFTLFVTTPDAIGQRHALMALNRAEAWANVSRRGG